MATLCGQAHCLGHGSRQHLNSLVSCSTSSSNQLHMCSSSMVRPSMKQQLALPLLPTSTSSIKGTSSYFLVRPLHHSRAMRRSQPGRVGVIKAAFIFEWFARIFRFFTRTPIKLFAQKVEDDLDRAAKMIKTGAAIVAEVAKDVDEFAETVEIAAERAEAIAEKVAECTEQIEERADEILDVIEGEKKVVITNFKVVENEDAVTVKSTTIEQDGNKSVVTVETSTVIDSNLDKTNSP